MDLDKEKFPPYATIHLKESNGDRLTVFTPNSDMWQDSFGETFAGLIGKPIEVYGQIDEWREGAGVRVLTPDQLKVIDAVALANIHESHPAWLTAPIPTQVLVDTPEYVGWRKYSPGTKVGLEYRLVPLSRRSIRQFNPVGMLLVAFVLFSKNLFEPMRLPVSDRLVHERGRMTDDEVFAASVTS